MVTIADLIKRREEFETAKKKLYDIETSAGVMTFKIPDAALVAESLDLKDAAEGNAYIIYHCSVNPNLRDAELRKAYDVINGLDVVEKIFLPGEIGALSGHLLKLAGYGNKIVSTLHKEIKNS